MAACDPGVMADTHPDRPWLLSRETLEPAADVVLGSIAELPDWVAGRG